MVKEALVMPKNYIILSHEEEKILSEIIKLYKESNYYGYEYTERFGDMYGDKMVKDERFCSVFHQLIKDGLIDEMGVPTEMGRNRQSYKLFHLIYTYGIPAIISAIISIITAIITIKIKLG